MNEAEGKTATAVWRRILIKRFIQEVVHPEGWPVRVYTRSQSNFMEGSDIGIGFSLCDDIAQSFFDDAVVLDEDSNPSIKEVKSGPGAQPGSTHSADPHTGAEIAYKLAASSSCEREPDRHPAIDHVPNAGQHGSAQRRRPNERVGIDQIRTSFCDRLTTLHLESS